MGSDEVVLWCLLERANSNHCIIQTSAMGSLIYFIYLYTSTLKDDDIGQFRIFVYITKKMIIITI
jgi:hypothetical protein